MVSVLTPHSISRVVSCGEREVSDVTPHSMQISDNKSDSACLVICEVEMRGSLSSWKK